MQIKSFKDVNYRRVKERLHFFHKREEDLAYVCSLQSKKKHPFIHSNAVHCGDG
jgi:hypothetical protein